MTRQPIYFDDRAARPLMLDGAAINIGQAEGKLNKLFPLGATKYRGDFPDGKLTFSQAWLSAMVANWRAMGSPELPVNYCHLGQSTWDNLNPIESRVAAGWITDVELKADGLWAMVKWNDKAREHIKRDEFRYLSPEFYTDYVNSDTGKPQGPTLVGLALLNDPFLKELPRVAASDSQPAVEAATEGEAAMDPKILKALKLSENATVEEVLAAVAKLSEGAEKAVAMAESAKALADTKGQAVALAEKLTKSEEQVKTLTDKVTAMEQAKRDAEVDGLWKGLLAEGKVIPAQHETFKTIVLSIGAEKATEFYKAAKPVVDLKERGSGGGDSKDPAVLRKLYNEKVDALRKTGLTAELAARQVNAENPELAKAIAFTA